MQFPVELKLRGCSLVKASVWVVHAAAALALFHVPVFTDWEAGDVDRAIAACAWALIFLSLFRGLRAQARLDGCTLWLERDGALELLQEPDGEGGLYRVRERSQVVLPMAAWFTLVPAQISAPGQGAPVARTLFLVPGNLSAGSFRLLRVWLRHRSGRVGPEAAAR